MNDQLSSVLKVRLGIVAELTNPFVKGKVMEMLQLQVFSLSFCRFRFRCVFVKDIDKGRVMELLQLLFFFRFRCVSERQRSPLSSLFKSDRSCSGSDADLCHSQTTLSQTFLFDYS